MLDSVPRDSYAAPAPITPRVGFADAPSFEPMAGEMPGAALPRPARPIGSLERAFTAQTPQETSYQELQRQGPTETKPGIWNRIKAALVSGALAAREAGAVNPDAAGAAFLGGAIGGGVSRGFGGNMRHNLLDLPRARGLAAESRELADAGLNRRMGFARAFGHDPETGEPTADTSRYESEREFRAAQAAKAQETDLIEQLLRSGIPIPPGLGPPQLQGKMAAPKPTTPRWAQDATGKWVDLNAAAGPVQGRDPNAITPYQQKRLDLEANRGLNPYQQAQVARQDQQDAKAARQEAIATKAKFESLKTKAETLDAEWRELQKAAGQEPTEGKDGGFYIRYKGRWFTPDEVAAMRDEKEVEANGVAREFNDLSATLEGHPYIKKTSPTAIAINEQALRSIGRSAQSGGSAKKGGNYVVDQQYPGPDGKTYIFKGYTADGKMRFAGPID